MILLDTNVISALMRPLDHPVVRDWINRQSRPLFVSTITIFEIRLGIALLPPGRRAASLQFEFEGAMSDFGENILDFDEDAAEAAALLGARRKASGRNTGLADTLIAGIAISCKASIATRNVKDFADSGCLLLDPFAPQA